MADDQNPQIPNTDVGDENSPSTPVEPDTSSQEPTIEPQVEGDEQPPQVDQVSSVNDERPISDLSEQRFFPVENLESKESLDSPTQTSANQDATNQTSQTEAGQQATKRPRFKNGRAIIAIIILGLLITGLVAYTQLRQGGTSDDTLSKFTEQSITVNLANDVTPFDTVQDQIALNGSLLVATSGGNNVRLSATGVSGSQTYIFPNGSGTLCIDTNNCGYISSDSINGTTGFIVATAGADGVTLSAGDSICQVSNNCLSLTQGGNAFGETLTAGTTDNFGIDLITGGQLNVSVATSGGLTFGAARDTNLYRMAANALGTDSSLRVNNKLAVGSESILGGCGEFFGSCSSVFNVHEINRDTAAGTNPAGGSFTLILDPATSPTYGGIASAVGGGFLLTIAEDNPVDFGGLYVGSYGLFEHKGSGDVDVAVGSAGVVRNLSAGHIDLAVGFLGGVNNEDGGTIDTATGIFIPATSNGAGGSIDTVYGMKIDTQMAGTTNSYGLVVGTAATSAIWIGDNADNTTVSGGITFGLSKDTNLYRSAADTLKTDSSLAVGLASPGAYQLDVATDSAGSYVANFFNDGNVDDRYGLRVQAGADAGSGTTYYLDAYDGDGDQVGFLANVAGTFGVTDISDSRTKTNIVDTSVNAMDVLNNLRVVDFNRNQNPDGPTITGFIAQEVLGIYPKAVTTSSSGLYGIQKDAFIPLLVRGVQEQQVDIKDIARRVGELESSDTPLQVNVAQLTADSINVTTLKVAGTLSVAGSANIGGDLGIGNDLNIGGRLIGNSDTRGEVMMTAGSTEVQYKFSKTLSATPIVILTATNDFAPQYRVSADNSGFTVHFKEVQSTDVKLNYQVQL